MASQVLINVEDYERAARERLDPMIYDYMAGGALDETTIAANRAAYDRWSLYPRVLVGVGERDHKVSVLGDTLSMPIGIAPSAFHRLLTPEGEIATARAAGAAGTVMTVATMATQMIEDIAAAASGPLWFQTFVYKDRGLTAEMADRAHAAGYRALVLTVDSPILGRRERDVRNQFQLPAGIEMSNLKLPPAVEGEYQSPMTRFIKEQFDASLNWADVERFIQSVKLPVLVKGVLHPDDAAQAVKVGAAGIIVSNHGGRQLDGAIPSLVALDRIRGDMEITIPVIMDGGIRRGADVVKAMALGATMVMTARPVLWGLAVNGAEGALSVLEMLRAEFDTALALIGCPRAADLNEDFVVRNR